MSKKRHPLERWLSQRQIEWANFAQRVGCSDSHLINITKDRRGASLALALSIERETKGEVPVSQMLRQKQREAAE